MVETVNILGVDIAVTTPELTAGRVRQWIAGGDKVYLCFAPVSTLVDCQKDEGYRQVINGAALVNPDGVPVVWVARAKGNKEMHRTCGPDFMSLSLEQSTPDGPRHFLYGGTDTVKDRLLATIRQRWPQAVIAGAIAPPFRASGVMEDPSVIDEINAAKPDILWVGLGSPKQDVWMANHREQLTCPVICGVGAAFDFIAGTKPMAPGWMRANGLEWLFRLSCEPRRLWRRYIVGNTQFLYYLVTKELLRHG